MSGVQLGELSNRSQPRRPRSGRIPVLGGGSVAVLLLFIVLATGLFWSAWRQPGRAWVGVGGDPNLVSWFLTWVPYAISHAHNPLLSSWLDAPTGVNLMWNTSMPLMGALLWPVTQVGGPVVAYDLLITLSLALSAWTAFLAIRELTLNRWGALLGGLLYGFSPYMLTESLAHVHVVAAFLPPLMLLLLADLLVFHRRPARRAGGLLGLVCAAQVLTGEEVLVGAAVAAAAGALVLALICRDGAAALLRDSLRWVRAAVRRLPLEPGDQALPALLRGLLVLAVLAAYPLAVQFLGPHRIHGSIQPRGVYVSDLLGFLLPTDAQAIAPAFVRSTVGGFSGNGTEWTAYLGAPLLLLLAAAVVVFRRDRLLLWAVASAAVVAILSLGPHLHVAGRDTGIRLPELLLDRAPVVGNLQANRLALFTDLFVAVAVGALLARLTRLPQRPRWLAMGALLLAFVPLLPRLPFPATAATIPAYFDGGVQADVPEGAMVLVIPFADFTDADAMAWQATSMMWFRMPEGYFVNDNPDGSPRFGVRPTPLSDAMLAIQSGGDPPPLDSAARAAILGQLRDLGVVEVVVGPMPGEDRMLALWSSLLGRPPDRTAGGVYVYSPAAPRAVP
jgi:hypothetical protein